MQINGTADVTSGSNVVTATAGADWSLARAGNWFTVAGSAVIYSLAATPTLNVSNRWEAQLTVPYAGSTQAGADIVIHRDFDSEGLPIFATGDTEMQPLLNRAFKVIRTKIAPIPEFSGGTGALDLSGYTLTLPASMTLEIRRGTRAELNAITPPLAEPGYITDSEEIIVGDGVTAGGKKVGLRRAIGATSTFQPTTQTGHATPDALVLKASSGVEGSILALAYQPNHYMPLFDVAANGTFILPTNKPLNAPFRLRTAVKGAASSTGLAGDGGRMFDIGYLFSASGGNGGASATAMSGGAGGDLARRIGNAFVSGGGAGGAAGTGGDGGKGGDGGLGLAGMGGAGGAGGSGSGAIGGTGGDGGSAKGYVHLFLSAPPIASGGTVFSASTLSQTAVALHLQGGAGGAGGSGANAVGGAGGHAGKFAASGGDGSAGTTVPGAAGGNGGWLVLSGGAANGAFAGGNGGGLFLSGANSNGSAAGGRGGHIALLGTAGLNAPDLLNLTAAPEGVIAAAYGSVALLQSGSVGTPYYKRSGTGNTGWRLLAPQRVLVRDVKSSGVEGGAVSVAQSWDRRDLTELTVDETGAASLSNHQVTLPSGTYHCVVSAPMMGVGRAKTRLRNVTDGVTLAVGSNTYGTPGQPYASVNSIIIGVFTLSAPKAVEVQMATINTNGALWAKGTGLGTEWAAQGESEIFTQALFVRVA